MMYEFLTDFMGFPLTENQVFLFGAIFIIIMLVMVYRLFVTVIKLFK